MTFQSPDFRSSIGGQRARSAARALTASLAAVTLVVSVGPTVNAQSAGSDSSGSLAGSAMDPGSLVPSQIPGSLLGVPSLSLAASTQIGAPIQLTDVLGSLAAVGSSDFARPGSSGGPTAAIARRDPSIDSSVVKKVEPLFPGSLNPDDQRAEVWTVTSKTMQRDVRVEVYRAPIGVDAPNVYFLDGLGSNSPSGWSTGMGWGDAYLRGLDVNVIAPTGAPAAMWSDWKEDDPVLGPNNWETFLTEELPPLLEAAGSGGAEPLAHNRDWGVMGLSMGASAALHLANTQEMFSAVAGISGAYSTTDELGYQYARLTVGARNGDVTKMWGPRGSQAWRDHDTLANPSGLSGKHVYLSAATGIVGSTELGHFGSNEMVIIDGHVLEKGSYESTLALEAALRVDPSVSLRTTYMPTGIHNWPVFVSQMRPGMEHLLSGLDDAVPNGLAAGGRRAGEGALGSGSLGSSGSTGSAASSGSAGSARSAGSGGSNGS